MNPPANHLEGRDITQDRRAVLLIIPWLTNGGHDLIDVQRQDLCVDIHIIVGQKAGVGQKGKDGFREFLTEEGMLLGARVPTDWKKRSRRGAKKRQDRLLVSQLQPT